ncbi:hypothetical protein Tco_0930151 [Tanacetum coccineum]
METAGQHIKNMSEDMDQLVNMEVEAEIIDVPDDYGLEVVVGLLQATRHTVAVKRIKKVEGDDSGRRLVELKSYRSTGMITGLDDTDSARSKMEKKVPVSPTKPKIKTDDPLSP